MYRSDPVLSPALAGGAGGPLALRMYNGKPWTGRSWARWSFRTRRPWRTCDAITHKYVAPETARRIAEGRQAGFPQWALTPSPCWRALWRPTVTSYPGHHRAGGTPGEADHGREGISRLCPDAGGGPKPSAWFQAHCDDFEKAPRPTRWRPLPSRLEALFQQMLEESK